MNFYEKWTINTMDFKLRPDFPLNNQNETTHANSRTQMKT